MSTVKKRSTWQVIRKLANDIHLWLGLASGLIVIAVCFSGTVYVFNTELTERAAPHLYTVKAEPGSTLIPVDSLLQIVQQANPEASITAITVPAAKDKSYRFAVKKTNDKNSRNVTQFVNPYTGTILGNSNEKNGTKEFMGTMFSLHRWLLLDKIEQPIFKNMTNRELGSMITGWATIIFTLGCITGLIIWFPQKVKYWRQGLKIKWKANWKRVNHDLHNTLAFYALLFLLLMGLTGPQWSFDWYRTGLQKTLGTYQPKAKEQDKKPAKDKVTDSSFTTLHINEYIAAAGKALPYKGDYSISLPEQPVKQVNISKYKTGFFAPAAADKLTIDAVNNSVTKKDIFKDKPFNERVAGSIKAIHVGNVYGMFTKIIYFIACLIATTLPITGTLIWLNKLKTKRRQQRNRVITPLPLAPENLEGDR
ncbi:PepSY-associated TM helix domain-containing protein [Terrimonas rubra]|uniref:PepSY-associated TM helix domain-containing protein n=1 Tax=Terrimonas rubra TaxID=1035890 RepID=A0ABW6A422_9BACT